MLQLWKIMIFRNATVKITFRYFLFCSKDLVGNARFESRPGRRISWLRFPWFSSDPLDKYGDSQNHYLSESLLLHYSSIQYSLATESAVKLPTKEIFSLEPKEGNSKSLSSTTCHPFLLPTYSEINMSHANKASFWKENIQAMYISVISHYIYIN